MHLRRNPHQGTAGRILATILLLVSVGITPSLAVAPDPDLSALEVAPPALPHDLAPIQASAGAAAVSALAERSGTQWAGTWDGIAGRIDQLLPGGYRLAQDPSSAGDVEVGAREFLAANADLFGAAVAELRVDSIEEHGGVWWVAFRQEIDGLPILGARLDLRLDAHGNLVLVRDRTLRGMMAPSPGMDAAAAERLAAESLNSSGLRVSRMAPAAAGFLDRGLTSELLVPVFDRESGRVELRRAWRVRQEIEGRPARFATLIDVVSGGVIARTNELFFEAATGSVTGDIQPSTPTDPYSRFGLEDLRLTIDGAGTAYTGETGGWSLEFPDAVGHLAHAGLDGRYSNIQRQDGPDAQITGIAQTGAPLSLVFTDANSDPAERDVYYHMNLARDYVKGIDPAFTGVDYEMPGNVNLAQTCNAYWDGYAVNFFLSGGGCANTGQIADVIYHEYGHGVTQFAYAPVSPDGSMNEGFSDYLAATITDQPLIGLGFYGPGTYLRTCDNNRQWPASECGGEVHCVGEVMAGCLWHMRQNLIAAIGNHDAAVTLSDHLFHFAKYGHGTTFEDYYFDLLAVDDDNGTLLDGTPHAVPIIQAFDRHNVGPGFVLEILHTPLRDTDRTSQPYPVVAQFGSPVPLNPDSLALIYTTQPLMGGPISGPHRVQMTPTGGIREFVANIPGQPLNTQVRYYVRGATATMNLHATDPAGAPASQHHFVVAIDVTPPVVSSEPKTERSRHVWAVPVEATVTDNQNVGTVVLQSRINGRAQPDVALADQGGNLYRGIFPGSVAVGDVVEYRLKASDQAGTPNVTYLPATGYDSFPIVRDILNDVEHGFQDWNHSVGTTGFRDQWHISTRRNHSGGGASSWKFGNTGTGNYTDGGDGVLQTLPIQLGTGAALSFWHWIAAEEDAGGQAWDGACVEISTDGGASWASLTPIGGYTHQIISNPASPFPAGYPVWSGSYDWRLAQFDLSGFAGQAVRIRWRFGSDGYVGYEGWYVDDINLVTTTDEAAGIDGSASVVPERTALVGTTPNPFNPRTTLRFAIAPGAGSVRLTVHDVSGRIVKTLFDGVPAPGVHDVVWDGKDDRGNPLATGVYFAVIRARGVEDSRKLLMLK
jgi:hypothetical protein